MIRFIKYHGTGNDFILIDDRISKKDISAESIRLMCDRNFGIGADGLIQIRSNSDCDFEMLYYNSDGLPGSMCGNGGRCAVAFAHSLGLIKDNAFFRAFDGMHRAEIISTDPFIVRLDMNDVSSIEINRDFIFLNTGSPHYVKFATGVDKLDIVNEGRSIRYNERFGEEGTNVNFVELFQNKLFVRTYERGVENETLSCGTGVTASVIASAVSGKPVSSGCQVVTPGGILTVHFKKAGDNFIGISLEGGAERVFSGEYEAAGL